jgi:hypothetical protein
MLFLIKFIIGTRENSWTGQKGPTCEVARSEVSVLKLI